MKNVRFKKKANESAIADIDMTFQDNKILNKKHLTIPLISLFVEYFEYAIYSLSLVKIGGEFFPASSQHQEIYNGFVFFLAGAALKPIASYFLGMLGDLRGRAVVLRWSLLGIGLPTLLIGCIPNYDAIGLTAPVLLIIARLVQSVFLSAESDHVGIYLIEHAPPQRKYLYYSMSWAITGFSFLCANVCVNYVNTISLPNSWRIPFIISGIMGIGLIFISRGSLKETPAFEAQKKTVTFQQHMGHKTKEESKINMGYKTILGIILMLSGVGGAYQFFFIFLNTMSSQDMLAINSGFQLNFAYIFFSLSTLIGGLAADQSNGKHVMTIGFILSIVIGFSAYFSGLNWLFYVLSSIALGLFCAPGFVMIIDKIPMLYRSRTIGLCHSLSSLLVSKSTPLIAWAIWNQTGSVYAVFAYYLALKTVAFFGVQLLERRLKN